MTWIRGAGFFCACVAGLVIAVRAVVGPFRIGVPVNTPFNVEGVFAVAVLACLLAQDRAVPRLGASHDSAMRMHSLYAASAFVLGAAAFAPSVSLYYLSDESVTVVQAMDWLPGHLGQLFGAGGGDGFFRPIGSLSLWLTGLWARVEPVRWHAAEVLLHAVNCVLVYFAALEFRATRFAAGVAAGLFALHAIHSEAVLWIASRFDLLVTTFVLASFLLFGRACQANDRVMTRIAGASALLFLVLAILTKENAYAMPVFLVAYAFLSEDRKRALRLAGIFALVSVVLFVYRWTLFGGIGGYRTAGPLSVVSTAKALGLRMWSVLFFPINWTYEMSWMAAVVTVLYIAAVVWIAVAARIGRTVVIALLFALLFAIPAFQLLLTGPGLGNSRILYLPSVGFCVATALGIESLPRHRIAVAAVVLVFHATMLHHNFAAWARTSSIVHTACSTIASSALEHHVIVRGVPNDLGEIPAFANGLEQCVNLAAGAPLFTVVKNGAAGEQASSVFVWDSQQRVVACVAACRDF